MRSRSRYRRGFTVVETLAVLTVGGIVLSFAVPPAMSAVHRSQVKRAARVVATDLQLALSSAAGARRPVRIEYESGAKRYTIARIDDGTVLRARELGDVSAYALSTVSFEPAAVDVFPTGRVSSGLAVTLTRGEHARQVSMMRSGMIQVLRP